MQKIHFLESYLEFYQTFSPPSQGHPSHTAQVTKQSKWERVKKAEKCGVFFLT